MPTEITPLVQTEPRPAATMPPVGGDFLRDVAPRVGRAKADRQREIVDAVGGGLRATLAEYLIDSVLRVAHFTAQIAHESDGFCTTEEYASGAAYEGRLDIGNTEPGDGRRFKGRGLIQLTGRANYRIFGERMGIDLIAAPEAAAEPKLSLRIACEYWTAHRINVPADRDDLVRVTKLVNGRTRGLTSRAAYLAKAKTALARLAGIGIAIGASPAGRAVLHRGSRGGAVVELQEALRAGGVLLAIDGDFGPATELGVRTWQAAHGLEPDGIVGPRTWASLRL